MEMQNYILRAGATRFWHSLWALQSFPPPFYLEKLYFISKGQEGHAVIHNLNLRTQN